MKTLLAIAVFGAVTAVVPPAAGATHVPQSHRDAPRFDSAGGAENAQPTSTDYTLDSEYYAWEPMYNGYYVPWRCDGNGTSGYRIQLVYAHVDGAPDVMKDHPELVLREAQEANATMERSSNGQRSFRWVHNASCVPTIERVHVTRAQLNAGSSNGVEQAVAAQLKDAKSKTRKMLVLVDYNTDAGDCGVSAGSDDTRPGPRNQANTGGGHSVVWPVCWGGDTPAHELMHNLGAVHSNAPHYDSKQDEGHCYDGIDTMCDGWDLEQTWNQTFKCHDPHAYIFYDCGGDDYFNVSPPAGSYLSKNWDTANNRFLIRSKPRTLPTQPSAPSDITVTKIDATHASVTWGPSTATAGGITRYEVWTDAFRLDGLDFQTPEESEKHDYYVSATKIMEPATARSATITLTSPSYTAITVVAVNDSGYSWVVTPPTELPTDAPPTPITNVGYQAIGPNGLPVVSWDGGQSPAGEDPSRGCYIMWEPDMTSEYGYTAEEQRATGDLGSGAADSYHLYKTHSSGEKLEVQCIDAAGRTDSAVFTIP